MLLSYWLIIILCVKYHSNSWSNYSILSLVWKMNYMHFEIKSLTVYRMLWICMKMELICIKLCVCIEIFWCWCIKRIEVLCFLFFIFVLDKDFNCIVCVPINSLILNIPVVFLKFILNLNCWKWIAVHVIPEIDWALSLFSASRIIYLPVCSILRIVVSLTWYSFQKDNRWY